MHRRSHRQRRMPMTLLAISMTMWFASGYQQGSDQESADLLIISLSDIHSSYRRMPAVVPIVRDLLAEHAGVPARILLAGDLFEAANSVARLSQGEADWKFLESLDLLAPVTLNLGNHEPDFELDMAAVVAQAHRRGIEIVTDLVDRRTGNAFAPRTRDLHIPGLRVLVHGVATDALATYPSAVRSQIETRPWRWPASDDDLTIVLSHAGVQRDREILAALPQGSLVIGGHDHAHIVHHAEGSLYLQGESWARRVQATKVFVGEPNRFEVIERVVDPQGEVDQMLADVISRMEIEHSSEHDREIIGTLDRALSFREAIESAARGVATATGADVGFLGFTTFGDDLPAGNVSRAEFDAFLRFDGELVRAVVDEATLARILARSNLSTETPIGDRRGDFLCSSEITLAGTGRSTGQSYVIATNGWSAANQDTYFGEEVDFQPVPGTTVKDAVAGELFGSERRVADSAGGTELVESSRSVE